MSKIIDFEDTRPVQDDGEGVVFMRDTPETEALMHQFGQAMRDAGILEEQVEAVAYPFADYVYQSRKDAFKQGLKIGIGIGRDLGGGDAG